ncbi:MAG: DUF3291 domain-containing protein [Pseudomonadota bacterium]
MHVAQLNIARPLYPLHDSRMGGFTKALDAINALAERADGFVWRLKGDGNDATDLTFPGDPTAIANMSVWRTIDDLQQFVWTTVHRRFFDRKVEWFAHGEERDFVMWWVEPAHTPTLQEAAEKLRLLRQEGSTDDAFGWEYYVPKRYLGRIADGA